MIIIIGLLIDVSRHFQPIKILKETINAMEISKLNYLHLHLTDSQSFPVVLSDVTLENGELLELSKLAKKGSFSSEKIYKKEELIDLVNYAKIRGIIIINIIIIIIIIL